MPIYKYWKIAKKKNRKESEASVMSKAESGPARKSPNGCSKSLYCPKIATETK